MKDVDLKQFAANSSLESSPNESVPKDSRMTESVEHHLSEKKKTKETDMTEHTSKKKPGKAVRFFLGFFVVMLLLVGVGVVVAWQVSIRVQGFIAQGREVQASAMLAYDALKAQDLVEAKAQLMTTKEKYDALRSEYQNYGWLANVPLVGAYYTDGTAALTAGEAGLEAGEIAINSIEPYADVLGFKGEGTFAGGSVENRIQLALATLSKIGPDIDKLTEKMDTVGVELAKIDENRYPVEFRGRKIREQIVMVKELSSGASGAIKELRPVLEVLPDLAGANGMRRKYFVLFQNDNELRPTGGFMTAFAKLFVENGVITPEKSDDIYELDKKFAKKPPIPEILKQYLVTEKKWNLRDMNISPDFKESMEMFWQYYSMVPGEDGGKGVDGVIAIDTNVLERLVAILGPIEVPGYGTFTAEKDKRCDCPQIIYAMSEIVDRPTPYIRENRKGIIGPMMQSILSKAYGAPRQQWPALFQEAWSSIQGKHVQFYFFEPKFQTAAEAINAAGRLKSPSVGEDYFFVVDANLGGAKSNLFVKSEVVQDISLPENGVLRKTVTLTYKNPFKASNCNLEAGQLCLNARLFNWQRIYLPKGAKLERSTGYDKELVFKDQEAFTVAEGVFSVDPMGASKVTLTYTIPYENETEYVLTLQKQGGTLPIPYILNVNGGEHAVSLNKDQTLRYQF